MTYREIDINLTNRTKGMLTEVERFSMEVMRPAGLKLVSLSIFPEEFLKQ